jgi:hypothetical protein
MFTATQYFQVENGILVPVYGNIDWTTILDRDAGINIAEFGLMIIVGEIAIPIPEVLFDYFAEHRTVSLYQVSADTIMADLTASTTIERDAFLKAVGAYQYSRTLPIVGKNPSFSLRCNNPVLTEGRAVRGRGSRLRESLCSVTKKISTAFERLRGVA